jgi:HAE1 family hydrophobic/amphiphilic exporter-1
MFLSGYLPLTKGSLMIKYSVKKPFTVLVLVIAIFVMGFGGVRNMTPDLLPEMDLPYIFMITTYPGASPEKVEAEVTKPLERQLATLENLKYIMSESGDSYSGIFMEFESNADLDAIMVDILEKTSLVEGGWSDMVSKPTILKLNPDMLPVMVAAVDIEGMENEEISQLVERDLVPALEGVTGVASLDVSGLVEKQMNVVLRDDKITELNEKITAAVNQEFAEMGAELDEAQAQIESNLAQVESGNEQLSEAANLLAQGAGTGAAEIASNAALLIEGKTLLEAQIAILQTSLTTLIASEEALIEYASTSGITLPPTVTAPIAQSKSDLTAQIAALQVQLDALAGGQAMITEAQKQLEATVITGGFDLATGAAQLAAGQAQLSIALTQVQQGLDQLEEARKSALQSADLKSQLSTDVITALLTAQNFSMPAGYVYEGEDSYLVRVGDEIGTLEELQNLPLLDLGLESVGVIRLSDVADVFESNNLESLYAKINNSNGVVLSFNKQSTYATATVSENIKNEFAKLTEENPKLRFTPLMDQGEYIHIIIGTIAQNLLLGALFAILILFLFLRDIRPTFITLCSIPISVIFALVLMYFSGVTINIISLSGLAISVGMLVDNSIVVIENTFRLRHKGYSAVKSAVSGAGQVAAAITSSTLTTICVFLPIVFVHGITRQLFTDLALTLTYSLLASLIIALTLVPAMSGGLFRKMQPKEDKLLLRALGAYDRLLAWSLRHKIIVLLSVVVLLVGSMAGVFVRGFSFIPSADSPQITAGFSMRSEDATFEELKEAGDEVTNRMLSIDGVETVGVLAGGSSISSMLGFGESDSDSQYANYYIIAKDGYSGKEIGEKIKEVTADMNDKIRVWVDTSSSMDISAIAGSGIQVYLMGQDLDELVAASDLAVKELSEIEGVSRVTGVEETAPELRFTVDKEKAAAKGLTVAQVYAEVAKALVSEQTSTTVTWDGYTYDVVLTGIDEKTITPEYVKSLSFTVTKQDGTKETVKLSDIAELQETKSLQTIHRYEQRREVELDITVAEGSSVTIVANRVEKALDKMDLPTDVDYQLTGEDETITDAFTDLSLMMAMGIVLVYLVMVAQFQSLKNPFIILFTVPLAFSGGFLALLITGMDLSVIGLIGFVMLVGIIVNNGIVLVDYINQLRLEGMEKNAAIREAGATRMRPILMTALTTILGLSVMAIGIGTGSELMQPLAVVCIGGLAYGTFMTLFVVPIIYDAFNRKDMRKIAEEDLIVDYDI